MTVLEIVRLAVSTLAWEHTTARAAGGNGPSKYPYSDQLLDNAVMLGLYAVFTLWEVVLLVFASRGLDRGAERDETMLVGSKPSVEA
ncbi:hypothetical protein MNV49_000708 [Pseudohyphozyma bogoriensis]|nr:hypothetical protein MNV49_000708 [Pseudohyphozyma bogoriensis]